MKKIKRIFENDLVALIVGVIVGLWVGNILISIIT